MRKKKTTKVKKMNHDQITNALKDNIEDIPYYKAIEMMDKLELKIDNKTITDEEITLYLLLAIKVERM